MTQVVVVCTSCSRPSRVVESAIGQTFRCPNCGNAFVAKVQSQASQEIESTQGGADVKPSPAVIPSFYSFLTPATVAGDLGTLSGYRVMRLLGEGGMGYVFLGEDVKLRRPVALKVMKPEMTQKANAGERFLREGRAVAALKSDHVITIYQVGETNGVPYLAMEYLEGVTLDDWLKQLQGRPVEAKHVTKVARDVLRGLMAAHEKGLTHRDIKPSNLWVETKTQRIKILDFGLTRETSTTAKDEAKLTQEGQIVGTPAYMAPEQASGKPVDGRTDLFSLGVVLYRMLFGKSPFQRESVMATLTALAVEEPSSATEIAPYLPKELAAFIDRLMSKEPKKRPQSVREALAELAGIEKPKEESGFAIAPIAPATKKVEESQETGNSFVALSDSTLVGTQTPLSPRTSLPGWLPVAMIGTLMVGACAVLLVLFWLSNTGVAREGVVQKPSENSPEKLAANQRKKQATVTNSIGMKLAKIPAGTFMMGASKAHDPESLDHEGPRHEVTITRDFYLGSHEVTQEEYERVMGHNPSEFKGARRPVENVTWKDAMEFCKRLNQLPEEKAKGYVYRLPTEAEWEYACRAGASQYSRYHFVGDTIHSGLANFFETGRKQTTEVGSYVPNAFGLYDMHGNVWEWCLDGKREYQDRAENNPQGSMDEGAYRVIRGGSWDNARSYCTASCRFMNSSDFRCPGIGFRVLRVSVGDAEK